MPQVTSKPRIEQMATLLLLASSSLVVAWVLIVAATDIWMMLTLFSD